MTEQPVDSPILSSESPGGQSRLLLAQAAWETVPTLPSPSPHLEQGHLLLPRKSDQDARADVPLVPGQAGEGEGGT